MWEESRKEVPCARFFSVRMEPIHSPSHYHARHTGSWEPQSFSPLAPASHSMVSLHSSLSSDTIQFSPSRSISRHDFQDDRASRIQWVGGGGEAGVGVLLLHSRRKDWNFN